MAPLGTKGEPGDMVSAPSSAEGDAIKVYIRVRPPSEESSQVDGAHGLCLSVLSTNTIRLHSKPEPKIFTFDHVADVDTTQESVFSSVAKNIVESCMNGYNGTIFAYGQTGSGKTFTMMGPPDSDNFTHNLRGVIPRSFEYLFFLIEREKEKAGTGKSFLCKCSFIEIYNEQIFDLLDSATAGLFLREHITKGVFVVGAVEQVLTSAAEAYQVLTTGWRNRRVASTSMNRESSRSHAVFTITVESIEKNNEVMNIRSSQLNLVDLAGSERQKDTHAEGVRLKEAGNINRSLSCLGQVITALVDVGNGKQRHICYRDSRLTFLLRDSLGGNAKTCIIANVHPGSRCFGETLSTLNFAQRAKLIKNKAVINEDTQGNVRQLQSEVKKLKEQLALLTAGQSVYDASHPAGTITHDVGNKDYKNHFLEAMLFLEKSENERKILLEKASKLEDLCVKKEKFIQSNKMIIKFREDHIARLEKLHKEAYGSFLPMEQEELFRELKEELETLRDQVEQHPRVAKYAMENHILREENKQLRSLQSVKRAQEMEAQTMAELEKVFFEASGRECNNRGQQACSVTVSTESNTAASIERLKERLMHTQSELASCKQEHEEFKELTKKKQMELKSELQSVQKANQHLEKILEATKACKRQEVSYLNKMHRETLKNITTPTKAYQLRSRLVPRLTPEMLSQESPLSSGEMVDDIFNEPMPPEMNEQAYEAIAEELEVAQKELSTLQTKLDAEETKAVKLQQHINKLEHHSSQMQELFASERSEWQSEKQGLLEKVDSLEKKYQDTQNQADILKSEVHDLRIVLQSADKELSAVKMEHDTFRGNQEKEISELSVRHINVQLQLDNVRLRYEKLLEEKASLQDNYDNLQEILKFETDQLTQQILDSKQENETLKTELQSLLALLESEKEHNQKLTMQLQEDKEHNSREHLKDLQIMELEKQSSKMVSRYEQQEAKVLKLEQSLTAAEVVIASLQKTNTAEKEVVSDLMSQIMEMRTSICQKTECIEGLTCELEDLKCKYNSALVAKEDSKTIVEDQERQIEGLKETLERIQAADKIEKEILCEELHHTSEQLSRLTEASKNHAALLQSAQEDIIRKETLIQELQEQLDKKTKELENRRAEYESKMHQLDCVMESAAVALPQTPKTPPCFDTNLAKLLETHEQEIADQRASAVNLEHLVAELNEERDAKNNEILRLKSQLCELENTRLEIQVLMENNRNLQSQLEEARRGMRISGTQNPGIQDLREKEKELAEERLAKNKVMEEMLKVKSELERTRSNLGIKETAFQEMSQEMERLKALESKTFEEKQQIRSKLEETCEERIKIEKEMFLLRKQIEVLAEENGKLVGHQNVNQKIQYLVKLKKEHAKLIEEVEVLRVENACLKERCQES
ncbi:LOW QUALITY PROTEIN: kinesin-like protein KIF15 [Sceloporus undulatus]|uniref:LOW QUALITY PROTEIN: kinesin-like protein KIF15 n=1 Tax=Sceloporus undulatus TaxID=8520 RepID=UPI001C4BEC97|nr:LOW QUALITY PROTEIN: kinesin-like protein KIF15 [Sceloporus undulatus]